MSGTFERDDLSTTSDKVGQFVYLLKGSRPATRIGPSGWPPLCLCLFLTAKLINIFDICKYFANFAE